VETCLHLPQRNGIPLNLIKTGKMTRAGSIYICIISVQKGEVQSLGYIQTETNWAMNELKLILPQMLGCCKPSADFLENFHPLL
jgi:hypothetical protein